MTKIIFHSSRCNGMCPIIDLVIDSNRNIFVNREYYKTKSDIDNRFSGQFSGSLNQNNYHKLIELLQNCNLDTLQFPDITCCDGPVTTIIIYYNGQRKYFKSMTPPRIALDLISFLKTIGNDKKLKKTTETRAIEE
ncbi:MAG TPA: DUF6438 domain-containing protein [Hanamia sp.]|nr:DUF6438 domain-containing protein [Hanamia sp.]